MIKYREDINKCGSIDEIIDVLEKRNIDIMHFYAVTGLYEINNDMLEELICDNVQQYDFHYFIKMFKNVCIFEEYVLTDLNGEFIKFGLEDVKALTIDYMYSTDHTLDDYEYYGLDRDWYEKENDELN